jgi:hypothetical protein
MKDEAERRKRPTLNAQRPIVNPITFRSSDVDQFEEGDIA